MSVVKHFEANSNGRDFVVGDIHGCVDELFLLLDHLKFNKETDRLFSVGDLIDRGPQSVESIMLTDQPWFHAVRGNHDQLMVEAVIDGNFSAAQSWRWNGGTWVDSVSQPTLDKLATRLNELPYIITVGEGVNRRNIIHGEFLLKREHLLEDSDIDKEEFEYYDLVSFIWGRNLATLARTPHTITQGPNLSLTFCGHTPVTEPRQVQRQIFIDTGACYHYRDHGRCNSLTIADLNDLVFYSLDMKSHQVKVLHYDDIEKLQQ